MDDGMVVVAPNPIDRKVSRSFGRVEDQLFVRSDGRVSIEVTESI
jgi:hypothetical protein